jgi:ribosomal protein L22
MVNQEQKTEMKKQGEIKPRESEMAAEAKAKVEKPEIKEDEMPKEVKAEEKKVEDKPVKIEKKVIEAKGAKKIDATVNGRSLHISTKHSMAICNFIRGKNIEWAISELEKAEKMKIAIPMRGEIPHKKGMMSGRYPVKAIKEFIRLLKSLKANAIANELELEKVKISCKANIASRPYRRFGRKRFKRTHVEIKLVKITKKVKKNKKEKKQ